MRKGCAIHIYMHFSERLEDKESMWAEDLQ